MQKLYHPSGNLILIKFLGKRLKSYNNIITTNNCSISYLVPEKYRRKLLCEEEMAIIQSGGAYKVFTK
tara:strand:- start:979 stop:1182 length:204 start_codon:yes stop_codon:yes gene_type:complete